LNDEFTKIQTALENTLSRDGSTPNSMSADLDMNGNAFLNVKATTGDENFSWMGSWTTTTAYVLNNLVYEDGSCYICLVDHTSGTFATDLTSVYWELFASEGAGGAGSGDVVGPASAVTNRIVTFDGVTGKLIKDSGSVVGDFQGVHANLTDIAAITQTKGDLVVSDGTDLIDVAVGTNDYVLTADSAEATGVKWAAVSGGSDGDPVGSLIAQASSNVPTGYLECDGAAVSRTTYADLYTDIGTTYGVGNGSTTFNLPDLRGEFIRGWDHGKGTDSGRAIASSQADDYQSHTHSGGSPAVTSGSGLAYGEQYTVSSSSTGSSGGSETRPTNVAIMFCIKY